MKKDYDYDNGITIDIETLSQGIYDLMTECDKVIVANGMIPKVWLDMFMKSVRWKIVKEKRYDLGVDFFEEVEKDFSVELLRIGCEL